MVPPWNNGRVWSNIFIIIKIDYNKKAFINSFSFFPLGVEGVRKISCDRSSFGTYDRTTQKLDVFIFLESFCFAFFDRCCPSLSHMCKHTQFTKIPSFLGFINRLAFSYEFMEYSSIAISYECLFQSKWMCVLVYVLVCCVVCLIRRVCRILIKVFSLSFHTFGDRKKLFHSSNLNGTLLCMVKFFF